MCVRCVSLQEVLRAEHSVAAGVRSLSQHVREGGWEGLLDDLRGLEERCALAPLRLSKLLVACVHQCWGLLLPDRHMQDQTCPKVGKRH